MGIGKITSLVKKDLIIQVLAAIMKHITTILLIIILSACNQIEQQDIETEISSDKTNLIRGSQLFVTHCSPCHSIETKKTGPPFQRIRDDYGLSWTLKFVRNSERLIYEEKDTRAQYVFSMYNQSMMSSFPNLSDQEIIAILDYVDSHEFNSIMYNHRTAKIEEMKVYVEKYEEDRKARENKLLEEIKNFKK